MSFRFGGFCLSLSLAFALQFGATFFVAEGQAQTQQQQQQQKNKNKKKNKNLPPVPTTTLPPMTLANGNPVPTPQPGQPPVKTVDKEIEWSLSDDCTVQKLAKFPTGLNFVEGKIGELADGQKLTVDVTAKADKDAKVAKVDHYSGTLVRLSDGKLTLRCVFTEKDETPSTDGKEISRISIRTVVDKDG
jgi:hypothetical protein